MKMHFLLLFFICACNSQEEDQFHIDPKNVLAVTINKTGLDDSTKKFSDQRSVDSFINLINGSSREPMIFITNYHVEIKLTNQIHNLGINGRNFIAEGGLTYACSENLEEYITRKLK